MLLCYRYFQKSSAYGEPVGGTSAANQRLLVTPYAGSEYSNSILFFTEMRTAPTATAWYSDGTANVWLALPSVVNRTVTVATASKYLAVSAATTGDGSLQGNWSASAEL